MIRYRKEIQIGTNSASRPMDGTGPRELTSYEIVGIVVGIVHLGLVNLIVRSGTCVRPASPARGTTSSFAFVRVCSPKAK
jgi:hypothetical protein